MNNLSSYCGLVDAKIRASDKDLPVIIAFDKFFLFWVPRKTGRQKLESAFAFTVKHSKITVCTALIYIYLYVCIYLLGEFIHLKIR